ncbi:MAG: tetratricopeptide repeat protein [Pirellulaceae bacterium]
MGRSSALTPGAADLEDFSPEKATFVGAGGTRYQAEKVGDTVLHHEFGTDSQGRVIYDRKVPVSLAIGSGTRGKTYATNRDGILLQSPISWYSPKGGYFELSPGYENVATNPRFSRRIMEECLVCHIGRMEFDPDVPDKLILPYFHEIAIGCERCHGPGEKHVQAQQAGRISSPDPTIVNPARLPVRERESVCYQCHLHGDYRRVRYGRHARDFRPGMALEEIFCVLVKKASPSVAFKSVSQVEQMRESVCFQSNPEKLGCISCHNPHVWPEPLRRDEYYRGRCNECHAERGCSLPANQRAEKADSCIACHMPRATAKDVVHASQTDHRVLKNPPAAQARGSETAAANSLQALRFFAESEQRLPAWEVQRTRGMMLASGRTSEDPSENAVSVLLPLTSVAPDDGPLLQALGGAYLRQEDHAQARKWLEKAVALEPQNEQARASLALACVGMRDLDAAKEHISEVVKLNPYVAKNFSMQAKILAQRGEFEPALRAAEKVVELDPTQTELRDQIRKEPRK